MNSDKSTTLVLPTRVVDENSRSAWIRFAETVRESRQRGIIIDKTPSRSVAEELFKRQLSSAVEVSIAPYSEAYFRSMYRVSVPSDGYVQQFHDDDQWSGPLDFTPRSPGLSVPINVVISSPQRSTTSLIATQRHLSVFLGAISGVVWGAMRELVDMQGDSPSGALDIALVNMARTCGTSEAMPGFRYHYNDHHWADSDEALRRNVEIAAEAGWDEWASEELLQLTIRLDTLALLGILADRLDATELNEKQVDVVHSLPPRHRRSARVADVVGLADRMAILRLRMTQSAYLSDVGVRYNIDFLHLCQNVRSATDIQHTLLPWLDNHAPPDIRAKVPAWTRGLRLLQTASESQSRDTV